MIYIDISDEYVYAIALFSTLEYQYIFCLIYMEWHQRILLLNL